MLKRKKVADDTDKIIGRKIREVRLLAGLSQEKLGDKLGITFQQVQKYEKGVNRVSTKTLIRIASHLNCSIMHLIEDVIEREAGAPAALLHDVIGELGQTRQGAEVARLWGMIGDWNKRNLVVKLLRTLADQPLQRPPVTLPGARPDTGLPRVVDSASRPQLP